MATKRSLDGGSSASPPQKKALTQFEFNKIGPVYSQEDMDIKVLQFQNKKLAERIELRKKAEEELKKRIEQLEQRQTTDDAVLCIVNRYWNQLDEDVRVLLQRFDAESADDNDENSPVTGFLTLLSQWTQTEIENQLSQRVEFSKRAIGKLLQAFDRLQSRNDKLWDAIKVKSSEDSTLDDTKDTSLKSEPTTEDKKEEDTAPETEDTDKKVKEEKEESKEDIKQELESKVVQNFNLADEVKADMDKMMADAKRLHSLNTSMHQKHHQVTLKNAELQDKLSAAETESAELKNQVEELKYDNQIASQKVEKLDRALAEIATKLKTYQEGDIKAEGGGEGVSKNKFVEVVGELEEQREQATNRLIELEKLHKSYEESNIEVEKLKMDLSTLPEQVIVDTTEYKCLQSQFSVLYNESMQIKTKLEEARNMLATSKNTHLRQIEQMESDELVCQKKLRTELIQLEDQLSQVRREYEMLRIEFEQTLAANEQTGPINREMRNLISSLKNQNEQLKGEIQRYKRKIKEGQIDLIRVKTELEAAEEEAEKVKRDFNQLEEARTKEILAERSALIDLGAPLVDAPNIDMDDIKEVRNELKKCQDRERELRLLLDMYKSAPKENRDKVQLMTAEKRNKLEIEELKGHIRRMQDGRREDRRRLTDDDSAKKMKKLDDTVAELHKSLTAQKQEEEALLSEMEVTGQAFEDMQEQNIRLLQQLREKDDANFKLMSERIKSNQMHTLLREEKSILEEQVQTLHTQVEAQLLVVRKLEEKEQLLQNNLATVEKELSLRQQALEMHKRKAVESAQTAADLKLHLDKYHSQLKETQLSLQDKTGAVQNQAFKYKRTQEEVVSLRRKVERAKKIEMANNADEVLQEELREYKEQLTCPSCKVKKKDAILNKCFHVFCFECLKTRYETRQRKCPKCNAAFGANDYHRIYLE